MKYAIYVNIMKADNKGKIKTENFDYQFEEQELFDARKKAIAKVKELENTYKYDMPKGEEFDSYFMAQLKGFKNFKAYSINLSLVTDNGDEYQIYGEKDLAIESLEVEANYFYEKQRNYKMTEIENEECEFVQVLESELQFILK